MGEAKETRKRWKPTADFLQLQAMLDAMRSECAACVTGNIAMPLCRRQELLELFEAALGYQKYWEQFSREDRDSLMAARQRALPGFSAKGR
jgi:hypothetical protein